MASEMDDPEADEYWGCFIHAMQGTRLGDCKDSDPELAAAWLGWQAARRWVASQSDRGAE